MHRRDFLRTAALGTGAIVSGGLSGCARLLTPAASSVGATASSRVPNGLARNVILIISDTLRRDAVGCYGAGWVKSPHLDKFAAQAVVMDNAYLSSFPTVPCRNDVLTGRCTFTYKGWTPIDPDAITLQEIIAANGIRTALFADTPHPFTFKFDYQRGFDFFCRVRGQEIDPWKHEPKDPKLPCDIDKLRSAATTAQYLRNVHGRKTEEDYFVAQTMRSAAYWLKEHCNDDPFFMYVDTFDPHEPWDPPQHYVNLYDPGYTGQNVIYPRYDLWRDFLTEAELKHCRALYAGEASMVDRWIGHLLETAESLGLLKNTLVIITSDHGFYHGEHGHIGKALIHKNVLQYLPLYPEVSRIPMIVYYPGCEAGSRHGVFAQHFDLMPTILESLGLTAMMPKAAVGRSLLPALQGKPNSQVRKIAISSPPLTHSNLKQPVSTDRSTITDGRWIFIFGAPYKPPTSSAPTSDAEVNAIDSQQRKDALISEPPKPELYDLETDYNCTRNLYTQRFDVAKALHAQYVAFLERCEMKPEWLEFYRALPESK